MAAKEGRSFETSEREDSSVKHRIFVDPKADRDLDAQADYLAAEDPPARDIPNVLDHED